jgi:hypothetical protein
MNQELLNVGDIKLEIAQARQIYKLFLDKDKNEIPEVRTTKYISLKKLLKGAIDLL